MTEGGWAGTFLNEDEIVADIIKNVRAVGAEAHWTDPWSFKSPFIGRGPDMIDNDAPEHAGCLMFVGMHIRNHYGLWHPDCPITKHEDLEVTDGIITDPRHPDNVSARIIERVRAELEPKA